jgi:3-hydroxybutyryl-CoA dehydrogenase
VKVAVLGAGIMGSGIAQSAAMAGHEVRVFDISEAQLARAEAAVEKSLQRFVKAGTLRAEQVSTVTRQIRYSTELEAAASKAEIVIEAAPEILEVKQDVIAAAALVASDAALLGTNTSQLSITAIGRDLGDAASRLIGMHFFNPPVMMKLVELIRGLKTSDEVLERARSFCQGLGKEVVLCRRDSPGFLTSRAYAAFRLECVRMVEEGLATPEDIDKAFRLGFNFPMGPFELGDFNGVDTFVRVLDSLTTAFGERFRPTPTLRNMVAANHIGKKSGRGFYKYNQDGSRIAD